jgi:hypothetical protein
VNAFVERGLVLRANNVEELRAALVEARRRKPVMATSDPSELIRFLRSIVEPA